MNKIRMKMLGTKTNASLQQRTSLQCTRNGQKQQNQVGNAGVFFVDIVMVYFLFFNPLLRIFYEFEAFVRPIIFLFSTAWRIQVLGKGEKTACVHTHVST